MKAFSGAFPDRPVARSFGRWSRGVRLAGIGGLFSAAAFVPASGWAAAPETISAPTQSAAPAQHDEQSDASLARSPRVELVVDASSLGPDGATMEIRIADRLGALLRDAELLPARDRADGVIYVKVLPRERRRRGQRYEIHTEAGGRRLAEEPVRGVCRKCLQSELVAQIEAELRAELPFFRQAVRKAAATVEPAPVQRKEDVPARFEEPEPRMVDAPSDEARLGTMGKVGIATMAVGLGAVVAGAVLWAQGEVITSQPGDLDVRGRNYEIPGITSVAVGAAALVAGAVLLGVDRRRRARGLVLRVGPSFGLDGAGLQVGGRF